MTNQRAYSSAEWLIAGIIVAIGLPLLVVDPVLLTKLLFWACATLAVASLIILIILRPVILLWLLGIGGLFSLFGGDDFDCDL